MWEAYLLHDCTDPSLERYSLNYTNVSGPRLVVGEVCSHSAGSVKGTTTHAPMAIGADRPTDSVAILGPGTSVGI